MTRLPAPQQALDVVLDRHAESREPDEAQDSSGSLWTLLARSWLLICACILGMAALAGVITHLSTPVYEASTLIRIEDKQPNLPEIYRTVATGNAVSTEAEVLGSRALVADAASLLGLQVRVTRPKAVPRASLVADLIVLPNAQPGSFRLLHSAAGTVVTNAKTGASLGTVPSGARVRLPQVSFRLTPLAQRYKELRIEVSAFPVAVEEIRRSFKASPAGPDANILVARYRDTDADLVWRVPNAIAQRFASSRKEAQKSEVSSTVRFLHGQLDTLKAELHVAEDALRAFREREHVISPQVEANDQVGRLISLQAERSTMESERSALAKLLQEVTEAAAQRVPSEPSPYRKLIAFPSLLRNQAASELLNSLTSLQNERNALLTRRREEDPDVQALTTRTDQLEEQLRTIAATYLQGLTDQVAAIDTSLRGFGDELARLPRKEVDYGRLERQTRVLGDVYTLVQTRLKEAEITEAADDPSVRIIDEATMPLKPSSPKPLMNLVAGIGLGLVLGVGMVLGREHFNKTVRARTDIRSATGLPVVGLIPRLPGHGPQLSLVVTKARRLRAPPTAASDPQAAGDSPAAGDASVPPPPAFTFWPDSPTPGSAPVRIKQPSATVEPGVEFVGVTLPPSGTPVAEAYGSLLTNIAFARREGSIRTLVFTSAMPGDGKTTSAVNLALTLPARGHRVMLIDGDMRRGMIHKIFGQSREPGLSDVLMGRATLEQARRVVEVGDSGVLEYLPTGRIPAHPPSLLDSPAMKELLERLSAEYDRVIIDSPPANIVTDAELLGSYAEAVVLVARAGVTETSALAYAAERLRHVGARVIGVVLNDIDPKRDAAYDRVYRFSDYTEYSNTATD